MTDVPKWQRPKVKSTFAGGGLGGAAAVLWNVIFPPGHPAHLPDFAIAALVTIVGGVAGPLLRALEHRAAAPAELDEIIARAAQEGAQAVVDKLRGKGL